MDWIIEKLTKLSLGDKRLNHRAQKIKYPRRLWKCGGN